VILIVGPPTDAHARYVARLIQERGRVVQILHTANFGCGQLVGFDPTGTGVIVLADGARLRSEDISSVWYRRPRRIEADESITDGFDRTFTEQEWASTVDGFFSTLQGRVVNAPLLQRAAIKPIQLSVARSVGLRVPRTLITNDPEQAIAFVEEFDSVIHKAMSAPPHRFLDTRLWQPTDLARLSDLPLCPTLFQECVVGPSDIRVTVVGERVFAARIETSQGRTRIDSRLDLDAPCEPHTLPEDVVTALKKLMSSLGLVFATIDLKMTDRGEYVFLEVNPQGQFIYIEILTNLPISNAVADLLCEA